MRPSLCVRSSLYLMRFARSKRNLTLALLLLGLGGVSYSFWLRRMPPATPACTVAPDENQVNLFAIADWGDGTWAQRDVAAAMARSASALSPNALEAVLSAGDNIYPDLDGTADSDFEGLFERMYDAQALGGPFYMTLGNHDYSRGKAQVELEYAKANPESRWKLPAKWYRVDVPQDEPLVSAFMLDSNYKELSREDWQAQLKWLKAQLRSPRGARWLVACAHHPLFTQGNHGDSDVLIRTWGPLFRRYEVDLYVFGHDHIMQHLEVPGYVTSFVGSGGGGGSLHEVRGDADGHFAEAAHGFVHLRFGERSADVNYLNRRGVTVHSFSRPANVRRAATRPACAATALFINDVQ